MISSDTRLAELGRTSKVRNCSLGGNANERSEFGRAESPGHGRRARHRRGDRNSARESRSLGHDRRHPARSGARDRGRHRQARRHSRRHETRRHRRQSMGAGCRSYHLHARRLRYSDQQRRYRDHLARRRYQIRRRAAHVQRQRRGHGAGHEARVPRDAPRRRGGERRRGRQHLLGRRDHRVPCDLRLFRHQIRGRSHDPDRRDGIRQTRIWRSRQLHLSRPDSDRNGDATRQRTS